MQRTPCYDWHISHGGRMVDFAGWEMPVQYATIIEEHHAVRQAAGLFDIAHMGRLQFTGPDACRFLDHLVTNDVTQLPVGRHRYALVTNPSGGILDDVLVSRCKDCYLMVVNASNRTKILDWIGQHRKSFDVTLKDLTAATCMFALQGPRAAEILNPLLEADISELRYYTGVETKLGEVPALVSYTGYTGEHGFEIILPAEEGPTVWQTLFDRGTERGLLPAGLGCRDTLRLEAAMPLYGHELDETIDPFTAGLSFAVKLDAGCFLGKEALIAAKEDPNRRRRIGLELAGHRIARQDALLFASDREIGRVTSGTFSPTLAKPIAMGYVAAGFAQPGTAIEVDIRGRREPATVVKLPFYRRS